jgi:hypothetical protein
MSRVTTDGHGPETAAPTGEPRADGDDAARAAEAVAGQVAGWVARAVARAREETEDVWAEAQELRRGW